MRRPTTSRRDAKAKGENARATLGGPMLEAGGSLSEHLSRFYTGLQSFAEGSPIMSSALAGIAGLGGAALSAGEGVGTLAGLLRDLRGGPGAGGAGGGTGGGILGTGIDTGNAVGGGYIGWRILKAGASRLGLPGLILGGAAGSIYALSQQHEAEAAERERRRQGGAASFEQARKLRADLGGVLPPDVAARLARETFPGVGRAGILNTLDVKAPGSPGVLGGPRYDRQNVMAGEFARQGQPLRFPEVMREWIREVRGGVSRGELKQPVADELLKVTRAAFPDSFKSASEGAAEGLAKLPEPSERAGKALSDLLAPTNALPPALARFGGQLDVLSGRIGGIDLTPPRVGGYTPPGGTPPATGGPRRKFLYDQFSPFPSRETGGIVRRGGFVEVHDREAIVPAQVTDRCREDEFAGAPEFSLFGDSAAGGNVYNYNLAINVPPGSRAADDPQAFARLVMQKIDELQRENATLHAEVVRRTDPRRIERHIKHRIETEEERA